MSKALRALRRFIEAKQDEAERHEIRSYVLDNLDELADSFGASSLAITDKIATITDEDLPRLLLKEIKRVEATGRGMRAQCRAEAAQKSADLLGGTAHWTGDIAIIDIIALLATTLTRRSDQLVFTCDAFTVAIPMARLFDLSGLRRGDLTAYVDAKGLHVRWRTGGLNLRSTNEVRAPMIIVSLPGTLTSAAASQAA